MGSGAPRRSREGRGAERSAFKLARHDSALRLHTGLPRASPSGYASAHWAARPQADNRHATKRADNPPRARSALGVVSVAKFA